MCIPPENHKCLRQCRKQLLATSEPHPAKCFHTRVYGVTYMPPLARQSLWFWGAMVSWGGGVLLFLLVGEGGVGFAFLVLCGGGWGVGGVRAG